MELRPIQRKDFDEMLNITKLIYPESHTYLEKMKSDFKETFSKSLLKPHYLVVVEGNKVLGFAGFAPSRINYRIYEFFSLMVHPEYRRKGIGTKLVNERIKIIKSLKRNENEKYRIHLTSIVPGFLERFGFEKIGKPLKNGSNVMSLEI